MKKSQQNEHVIHPHWLEVDEMRLVCDLRIMHAKVDELEQIVSSLKQRHSEIDIYKYADQPVLNEDIARVDEIYLWFVGLKDRIKNQQAV